VEFGKICRGKLWALVMRGKMFCPHDIKEFHRQYTLHLHLMNFANW